MVVIEHNLDVIKTADWIIDIGPEGGDGGGLIVATGTPETIAKVEGSHTGRYLKDMLKTRGSRPNRRAQVRQGSLTSSEKIEVLSIFPIKSYLETPALSKQCP